MHPIVRQAADRVRRAIETRSGAFVSVRPSDVEMVMTGNPPPPAVSPRAAKKKPPERPVCILAAELEKWLERAESRFAPPVEELPIPLPLPEGGE